MKNINVIILLSTIGYAQSVWSAKLCCSYMTSFLTHCISTNIGYPTWKQCKDGAKIVGAENFKFGEGSCNDNDECVGSDIKTYDPFLVTLTSFIAIPLKDSVSLHWETSAEIDNLGMNLWCAQMQGNQFQEITKLNSELIPSKAILPNYGASYSSTDYPYVNTNLQPGVQHCTLEDIDASGQCTLHCDQIDTVVVGEGNNLSDTELNQLQAKAVALCNEHKQNGVCLDQLLAPHQ